jgi:hypothetical protein
VPKYLVLYNSNAAAREAAMAAPKEQVQASMARWMSWKETAEKRSIKHEWGLPLKEAERVGADGASKSPSEVSGSATLEGDHDTIVELLKTHPHLSHPGTSIDLLEMIPMSEMSDSE